MKFYLFPILIFITFFLASCGKEYSIERGPEPPPDTTVEVGKLLVKSVSKKDGAADSIVNLFFYDSGEKIKSIRSTPYGVFDTQFSDKELRYYRDGNGLPERFVEIQRIYYNSILQYEDSAVYSMHNTAGRHIYAIREIFNAAGLAKRDSVTYAYDGNGQLTLFTCFSLDIDNSYFEEQKTSYSYDSKGNITEINLLFKDDPSSTDPPQVIAIEHDDKISAADFGNDALLNGLYILGVCSPANEIKVDDPTLPQSVSYSYEYNINNMPAKGIETDLLSGDKGIIVYYYQ